MPRRELQCPRLIDHRRVERVRTGGKHDQHVHLEAQVDIAARRRVAHVELEIAVVVGGDLAEEIDVSGKVALKQQQLLFKGNNAIELNHLDRLMKGLYLIKMGDDEFVTTFKVMKK